MTSKKEPAVMAGQVGHGVNVQFLGERCRDNRARVFV